MQLLYNVPDTTKRPHSIYPCGPFLFPQPEMYRLSVPAGHLLYDIEGRSGRDVPAPPEGAFTELQHFGMLW